MKIFRNVLVLGSRDTIPLKIDVTNQGEPAYLCQLVMVLPDKVSLVQVPTGCTLELQQVNCLVGNHFMKGQKVSEHYELQSFVSNTFYLIERTSF